MLQRLRSASLLTALAFGLQAYADPIPVRYVQGTSHGFLTIKTLEGETLATGDQTSVVRGGQVISRLVFRFRDGSLDDDTTIYTQHGTFHLISDHHVQKGPSFPHPIDVLVEGSGQITIRTKGKDGAFKVDQSHLDLPPDVSNGLLVSILLNRKPSDPDVKVSFVAPTEKPRLIKVLIQTEGQQSFRVGGRRRTATDNLLKIELGGVAGVVAPVIGKQPKDLHFWILTGDAPAFIREEGQLYEGGPIWRIEQTSPTFPDGQASQ